MPASVDIPEESLAAEAAAYAETSVFPGEAGESSKGWFYGWLMLPLVMLMMISTAPGQTFGITYFNSYFREAFQLSHSQLSATYMVATILAAVLLPYIGKLIDRCGLKRSAIVAAVLMAGACAFTAQAIGVVSLFVAFVLLRMIGPGTTTLVANNTLAMWFDKKLGVASGICQVTMACALGIVPIAMLGLIDLFGWRGAYMAMSGLFLFGLLPVLLGLYKQSPEDIGQYPDGELHHCPKRKLLSESGLDVRQAMSHPTYWILLVSASTWALIGTGLIFHLVALFEAYGLSESAAKRANTFLAFGMASMQIVGGILADRLPIRWILVTAVGMIALACSVMALGNGALGNGTLLTIGFALFGCAQGLKSIVVGTVWPRYFGRRHLGKLRGTSLTAAIAGSSVGPVIMGLSADYWSGFVPSLWVFAVWAAGVAIACIWATPPDWEESVLQAPASDT